MIFTFRNTPHFPSTLHRSRRTGRRAMSILCLYCHPFVSFFPLIYNPLYIGMIIMETIESVKYSFCNSHIHERHLAKSNMYIWHNKGWWILLYIFFIQVPSLAYTYQSGWIFCLNMLILAEWFKVHINLYHIERLKFLLRANVHQGSLEDFRCWIEDQGLEFHHLMAWCLLLQEVEFPHLRSLFLGQVLLLTSHSPLWGHHSQGTHISW